MPLLFDVHLVESCQCSIRATRPDLCPRLVYMIEVQVHRQLLNLLRQQPPDTPWPHQLTMGRLVARALTTGRNALMQVSGSGEHRLSYLLPALSCPQPVIICAPPATGQHLLRVELPRLREHIASAKPICFAQQWPRSDWQGVLVTDVAVFLRDCLKGGRVFPSGVTVIVDEAQGLEDWATRALEERVDPGDWDSLRDCLPDRAEALLGWRVRLAQDLLGYSAERVGLEPHRSAELAALLGGASRLPSPWPELLAQVGQPGRILWTQTYRNSGQFSLISSPAEVATTLNKHLWSHHPAVVIGEALDPFKQAITFRARLGLEEQMTCLQFPADRREQEVLLYLPTGLPDPTAPQYYQLLKPMIEELIARAAGPLVVLLQPVELRRQLGAHLAALFGSRVTIDSSRSHANSVTLCSWEFWETHHPYMNPPVTLAVCNLPVPSLEDPLVAGRVSLLKQQRRDWFREYLLPETLGRLQRGISPLRPTQGLVALLDNRVNNRSYGGQLLDCLTPARRVRYLE